MPYTKIFPADKIFTGSEWLTQSAIVVTDGVIADILPIGLVQGNMQPQQPLIAPAFIDIQIYGAYGKLFSVYPDTDALHKLYNYCKKGGASHFQPTVATNSYECFYRCIDAVREYWKEGGKGCIGLHIEGPWINPIKKGAHLQSFIHAPSVEEVSKLLAYGKDVITMITIAPEVCSKEVVALIRENGVIISAGHTDATYEQATAAFNDGIGAATHLYNAMSAFGHRAPGMVGAIFDHAHVRSSIVPDGYHVDFAAIRIAKHLLGKRLFAITDAVTETTDGPYPHTLAGDKYESNGILSGSALDMANCLRNLVASVGIDTDEALRMVSLYPAEVMKLSDKMGYIKKGRPANIVFLDREWKVLQTLTNN